MAKSARLGAEAQAMGLQQNEQQQDELSIKIVTRTQKETGNERAEVERLHGGDMKQWKRTEEKRGCVGRS